ncbi:Hypothetical predicted protein [Olea europaea subsp. europaea]|uniref:Uncharacterized protein n=1 Tax=Olea europaea subsp. europaea TaxID=158383 RepID=A0A8S0RL10_OLEEU|nr:Hypothetical predicted protein [Olea europaea subsp. europaea]
MGDPHGASRMEDLMGISRMMEILGTKRIVNLLWATEVVVVLGGSRMVDLLGTKRMVNPPGVNKLDSLVGVRKLMVMWKINRKVGQIKRTIGRTPKEDLVVGRMVGWEIEMQIKMAVGERINHLTGAMVQVEEEEVNTVEEDLLIRVNRLVGTRKINTIEVQVMIFLQGIILVGAMFKEAVGIKMCLLTEIRKMVGKKKLFLAKTKNRDGRKNGMPIKRLVKVGINWIVLNLIGTTNPVAGPAQKFPTMSSRQVGMYHQLQKKMLVMMKVVGRKENYQMIKTKLPGTLETPRMRTRFLIGVKIIMGSLRNLLIAIPLVGIIPQAHLLDGVKVIGLDVEQMILVGTRTMHGAAKATGIQEMVLEGMMVKMILVLAVGEEMEVGGEVGRGEVTAVASGVEGDQIVAAMEVGEWAGEALEGEMDLTGKEDFVEGGVVLEAEGVVIGITEMILVMTGCTTGKKVQTIIVKDGKVAAVEAVHFREEVGVLVGINQKGMQMVQVTHKLVEDGTIQQTLKVMVKAVLEAAVTGKHQMLLLAMYLLGGVNHLVRGIQLVGIKNRLQETIARLGNGNLMLQMGAHLKNLTKLNDLSVVHGVNLQEAPGELLLELKIHLVIRTNQKPLMAGKLKNPIKLKDHQVPGTMKRMKEGGLLSKGIYAGK